ncbi:hypothetical protein LEP1GSC151_2992 [Leptospira interrogans serovar Grippotyphosa str. LT2186]|uniref:Uncharacterized protein n=5 Tax=Leptospira interrogans TaxID=173 RepID=M3HGG1_LEPIR|nr:hypothetical protein LEP1GSC104_2658 [Leptospira interrogans str. UI 12621]EKO87702.1 hypothetical protein LEP1GSC009_2192 [Leptospira interrogans serovar Grippotyphosa str. Andaman]EKP87689.1 hypothetical protein LEP1GSC020_1754 [Leptospira interrogans serovar Grippotyphosa str. 2006006986]EKR43146.1 hypothetical protein LEP1GSC097_0559 [Leptospira interrogans serovar Grippotyphosa str. UI 08368]EMF44275.1 hypothetical protein LEP1GSC067_1137 [Leptospira interrogans serovar Lora str. TE 199
MIRKLEIRFFRFRKKILEKTQNKNKRRVKDVNCFSFRTSIH